MTVWVHPRASDEFLDAIAYYEERERGLGLDLRAEILAAIDRIEGSPQVWPEIDPGIRRCLVHRFPYSVLYMIQPPGIRILAVMHLHRDPGYWKDRTES